MKQNTLMCTRFACLLSVFAVVAQQADATDITDNIAISFDVDVSGGIAILILALRGLGSGSLSALKSKKDPEIR